MIQRELIEKTKQLARQYPVVTITGPRQSGKTTLCRMVFPDMTCVSLEDLDQREYALCAGRTGQIVNLSSLGNDCGVNHSTVKSWLSVLEASYIIKLLRPYYKNFNKRLIKSPKLYFLDTGLACFLLDIQNQSQLATHPLRGALFESFIVAELLKKRFNAVQTDNLFYFRDNIGNEVDIIVRHHVHADAGIPVRGCVDGGFYLLKGVFEDIQRIVE